MFVSYEPYLAFDIHRDSSKCVCGKDIVPMQSGPSAGYCDKCYYDKLRFISNVTGSISLKNETDNVKVRMLEVARVKMIGDRLSFMIDQYYSNGGVNPYGNLEFIIRCYHDKSRVTSELISELDTFTKSSKPKFFIGLGKDEVVGAYQKYLYELCKMNASNWATIHDLCERRDNIALEESNLNKVKSKRLIEQ